MYVIQFKVEKYLLGRDIDRKTPMQAWSGKVAQDYDFLRIFGCPAYHHVKE